MDIQNLFLAFREYANRLAVILESLLSTVRSRQGFASHDAMAMEVA